MHGQEKTNTEQLILEVAEEEFMTKGFDGARTTSIARKAGVTHAMLHYYFRTKEQLFERVVAKISSIVAQTMVAAMGDPAMPVIERIKSGIASHFDLIAANPLLPRFFLSEIIQRTERYYMLHENLTRHMGGLAARLQTEVDLAAERGEMEAVDVRTLLVSILSLNVFPFVTQPFAEHLLYHSDSGRGQVLSNRKAENIEIIMRRIKKQ